MNVREYDVIAAEVHRKAIENVSNEMAISLVRTSGSPVVVDAKDFSTCLMDTTPEHLGFAAYVVFHIASSVLGTKVISDMLAKSGDLRPGDGWLVNDPFEGGAIHQGDVGVIMPMFHEGEHFGWGFVNMHILDIGGAGMGGIAPSAHDVFAEGLRFGAVRAIRDGAIEPEWERFIGDNVRAPGPVLNDIRSMIAANNVGNRKLSAVVDAFGRERYEHFCAVNKDLSEEVLRKRIARIPDGIYEALEWDEFDGHRGPDQVLGMALKMEVSGSDLRFTYSGAPQIDGFVNAGQGAMWGQTATALLTTLGYGDLPVNGGVWRPIDINLGEPGTIVNPIAPAPVSYGHSQVGMRACKLTRDVLGQALALSDDSVIRGRVGAKAHDGPPVAGLIGGNQHGTVSVVFYLDSAAGIGGGAQTVGDGQDVYGCTTMTGCGLTDIEAHQAADPLLFVWRTIIPNSGGPGQLRGGQGMEQAFALHYVEQMAGPAFTACTEVPASGLGGGLPGSGSTTYAVRESNVQILLDAGRLPTRDRLEGRMDVLPNKIDHLVLKRGDVLVMAGGGGGGLGDPLLREIERVAADVRDGYVTLEHADAAYGVLFAADGSPDTEATAARRDAKRAARIGQTPAKHLVAPETPGVSLALADGAWSCASCNERLGDADANWRDGAVTTETEIAERYAQLHMNVRPREEDPQIMLREHCCPACGLLLGADVVAEGSRDPDAPQLCALATT